MSSSDSSRLYISNLNFSSDEGELFDYFKDYGVVSVLIPSQTVRGFRNNQVRPLGIAYAEFDSVENLKRVIDDLNGKPFKGRELRLKPYVPYSPTNVNKKLKKEKHLSRFRRSKQTQENDLPPATDLISLVSISHQREDIQIVQQNDYEDVANIIEESEFSKDTVYCGYLPKSVTDSDLREFFHDFNPQEIWIFRTKLTRSRHFQIHRHLTAALISFETDVDSNKIAEALQTKRLLGKRIVIKPAYQAKIDELKQLSKEKAVTEKEIIESPLPQNESDSNTNE